MNTTEEAIFVTRNYRSRFINILCGFFAALAAIALPADAGALRLADKGVEIDGGSMGVFTLAYPQITTKAAPGEHETAMEQRLVDGKAVLKYPCGVVVEVSLGEDGKMAYRFSGNRDVVERFRVGELLVPPNYQDGGTWRIGDGDTRPFPAEKPAAPFLFQGNATRFEFTDVTGRRIRIDLPPYSFQQLQDNREWGWEVFAWWFQTPFNKDKQEHVVTVTVDTGDGKNVVLVDRFGQTSGSP